MSSHLQSPYSVLGVAPDATTSQVEVAYREKYLFWNNLLGVPARAAEAKAAIEALDLAHVQALAGLPGTEGGLVDPAAAPAALSGGGAPFGGLGGIGSVASGDVGTPVDTSACPKCGKRDNPPDADYCTNANCDYELRPPCPNCRTRVAWHQGRCHKCGVHLGELRAAYAKRAEEQLAEKMRREQEARLAQFQSLEIKLKEMKEDRAVVHSIDPLGKAHPKYPALLVKYEVRPVSEGFWKWVLMLVPLTAVWALFAVTNNPTLVCISTLAFATGAVWCVRMAQAAIKRGAAASIGELAAKIGQQIAATEEQLAALEHQLT